MNTSSSGLPAGLALVRTTAVFDNDRIPPGLLREHRIAADVWGRLVVLAGRVRLVFDDTPTAGGHIVAGDTAVIPPGRSHHVELSPETRFYVEFHRRPSRPGGSNDGSRSPGQIC